MHNGRTCLSRTKVLRHSPVQAEPTIQPGFETAVLAPSDLIRREVVGSFMVLTSERLGAKSKRILIEQNLREEMPKAISCGRRRFCEHPQFLISST
jgi:hypothetical protein